MNNYPFTIIRGGKDEKPTPKKKYATFDNKQALRERMRLRFIAERNKAILKLRAQGKL